MKTAIRKNYGSPEVIRLVELPTPTPSANQVLIKVKCTTVNRTDCANLIGKPFIMHFVLGLFKPKISVIGTDCAGIVDSVGSAVTQFKPGDRVCFFNDNIAQSQSTHTIVDENKLFKIPDNITFESAAAALEGAHYAYTFVHKVSFRKGQKVLLNGATGAIGSALLQFLNDFELDVHATCRTEHMEIVKHLGANKVIDYTQDSIAELNESYDFIFDAVGKSSYLECRKLLTNNGVFSSSELGPWGQNLWYSITTSRSKNRKAIFPVPYNIQKTMPYILDHLSKGSFNPLIDRTYPYEDIAAAYRYVLQGQKVGNVILKID